MRFYPDRPDIETPVRWFFTDPDADFLPFGHVFGSRNWLDDRHDFRPALGEVLGAPREWVNGQGPDVELLPRICGTPAEFASGQLWSNRENFEIVTWGVGRCCTDLPVTECPSLQDIGIRHPAVLYTLAVALLALSADDRVQLDALFIQILGDLYTSAYSDSAAGSPTAWAAAWNSEQSVVLVNGTTNAVQLGSQILGASQGPVDQGGFKFNTSQGFYAAHVQSELGFAGVPLDRQVVYAGHSLGGAICSWLLAKERILRPARRASAVTYGEPKCGDDMLRQLCEPHHVRLQNYGDPVPYMPPDVGILANIAPLFAVSTLQNWSKFRVSSSGLEIDSLGSVQPALPSNPPFADVMAILAYYALGGIPALPPQHLIGAYAQNCRQGILGIPGLPPCSIVPADIEEIEEEVTRVNYENQTPREVTFSVWTTGTAPPTAARVADVDGFIMADFHVRGEAGEGDAAVGHFSHVLLIPYPFIDIRDDYNEGTRGANYDIVRIPDASGTALVVRFVERVILGDPPEAWQRVYLDRRITAWPRNDV